MLLLLPAEKQHFKANGNLIGIPALLLSWGAPGTCQRWRSRNADGTGAVDCSARNDLRRYHQSYFGNFLNLLSLLLLLLSKPINHCRRKHLLRMLLATRIRYGSGQRQKRGDSFQMPYECSEFVVCGGAEERKVASVINMPNKQ